MTQGPRGGGGSGGTVPSNTFSTLAGSSSISFTGNSSAYSKICCSSSGQYIFILQVSTTTPYAWTVWYSSDSGTTFSSVVVKNSSVVAYGGIICNSTGQYVWVFGNNSGDVYRSTNGNSGGSVTFSKILTFPDMVGGLCISDDGNTLFAPSYFKVWYINNGTATTPTISTSNFNGSAGNNNACSNSGSSTLQYGYYIDSATGNLSYTTNSCVTWSLYTLTVVGYRPYEAIACDSTGEYIAYLINVRNTIYFSGGGTTSTFNFQLLKTVTGASFNNIILFTNSPYIYIYLTGTSAPYFYGGYSLISNCTTAESWTWTTIKSDQVYTSLWYAKTSATPKLYVLGAGSVLSGW